MILKGKGGVLVDPLFFFPLIVASIQKLPAASVLTDINFPMKGRKGMVEWARNSEDRVVIPKNIFTPMSTGKKKQKPNTRFSVVIYIFQIRATLRCCGQSEKLRIIGSRCI